MVRRRRKLRNASQMEPSTSSPGWNILESGSKTATGTPATSLNLWRLNVVISWHAAAEREAEGVPTASNATCRGVCGWPSASRRQTGAYELNDRSRTVPLQTERPKLHCPRRQSGPRLPVTGLFPTTRRLANEQHPVTSLMPLVSAANPIDVWKLDFAGC